MSSTAQATVIKPSSFEWRFATIKNGLRDAMAYRGDFLLDFFGQSLVPVAIQLILWYSIFHNGNTTSFGGMSYSQLIAYTWTSLGEKLLTAIFCLVLGMIATFFTPMSITNLILGMMLAILGNVIHYIFGAALAAVAFYWENAFAILMVKNMVVSLFSGELLPLSIVPVQYAWIWRSTPFYLYVYGPSQVALGKWDHVMWAQQMGIGILWLIAFYILMKITWKISIDRYQGLGG
jgi:ABC-type uncharacterized transport system permease subunit